MAPDKAARPVWLPVHTLAAGPAVDVTEFKGTASLGPTSRAGMRKGSSDLLILRDGTTVVECVGGAGGSGFFLSLLCFYVLDVEYLKTIIGNSLSPTARGWSLAQGGERLCSPRGTWWPMLRMLTRGHGWAFPAPAPNIGALRFP